MHGLFLKEGQQADGSGTCSLHMSTFQVPEPLEAPWGMQQAEGRCLSHVAREAAWAVSKLGS